MVPQKAALKIQQHESYTNTEENNETRTHTTIIHTHIHKHTYVRTYTYQREQGRKGKERKSKEREGVAGLGEVTNNKYTHTQAKMWEKRLNENYFKLFRKRTERKLERGKNGKANAKQEMGNKSKGKGSERRRERESVLPLASSGSVARVRRYLRKARGSRREISWTREKVEAKMQPVYESVFFRS